MLCRKNKGSEKQMTKLCQCCSKRYFCKEVDTKDNCEEFVSWLETKNYGEPKRIDEGGKNVHNKKRKFGRIKRR